MLRVISILMAAWPALAAASPAMADTVDLRLQFTAPDGTALVGLPVRVAAGTEDAIRSPDAGERGETDAAERRKITLDNWFVRHPSNLLRVAVEMELLGRQALYMIELDQVRDGTMGAMNVWIAGADGRFATPLTFHKETHSWSFPDDPAGMLMSSIGAELRQFELLGTAEEGWTATLVIEKQNFTLR